MTSWEARLRATGATRFMLGNHRLCQLICQGDTYEVLRGQNLFTGRVDVLKVMYRADNTCERRARHFRKLRLQCSIRSPQLVVVYDVGHRGTSIAVVEHVPGADIRALVRQHGPLPAALAATVLSQAALGLGTIHRLGMAHSNLQPNKILIGEAGTAKLCDAGEGLPLGTVSGPPPRSGRPLDFASPELFAGDEITPAADVYSLGCILYYAITGKVPFPGGAENDKRCGHLYHYPIDPRRLVDGLEDAFLDVMAGMMAKIPSKRIASVAEVVGRLEPWVQNCD